MSVIIEKAKKSIRRCMAPVLLLTLTVLLSGCTLVEPLYVMTDDEEDQIVAYASKVVSKYNKIQGDGMTRVYHWEVEAELSEEAEEESEEAAEEEVLRELEEGQMLNENGYIVNVDGSLLLDAEGNPVKGKAPEDTDAAASEVADGSTEESTAVPADAIRATVTDALALSGIAIDYNGFSVSSNYKEGDYLSLTPQSGKQYLIMRFTLKNPEASDLYIDILSQHPVFAVSVDGQERIRNESTILLYDLTTFQWNVPAGSSTDAVLLFQIPEGSGTESSSLSLQMTMNDTLYDIILQ